MKQLITSIFLFLFIGTATAYACLPGGITFTTQAQIDNFPIDYPGCTTIEGSVIIYNTGITNLNGLSGITSIGGDLQILFNFSLTNLNGLAALTSIGGNFYFSSNDAVTSLNGLSALTTVGLVLHLEGNDGLSNLNGLGALTSIGSDFNLINNSNLINLNGVNALTTIGGLLRIQSNNALSSLSGLNLLNSVESILIRNNPVLPNVDNLNNLLYAGGVGIVNNAALTSLNGLGSLISAGHLNFTDNPVLTVIPPFNNLTQATSLNVYNNSALTSLGGFNNLTSLQTISIYGNSALLSISGLNSITDAGGFGIAIGGNESLTSITGLSALTSAGSLLVYNNNVLTNISGLSNLSYVNESLVIEENASLTNVTALSNLTNAAYFYINNNDALNSLSGLENIPATAIIQLQIVGNDHLSVCHLDNICAYLAASGPANISGNAPGCADINVVETNCQSCPDADNDDVCDDYDNCPNAANPGQEDSDCDGVGDACDVCPGGDDTVDNNNDGLPDCKYPPAFADIIPEWKCGIKVYVCHNNKSKCFVYGSLADHIAHGDYIGPCGNAPCAGSIAAPGIEFAYHLADDRDQDFSEHSATVQVFPNPSTGIAWLDLSDFAGLACPIRLFDARGVLLRVYPATIAGTEPYRLDLSDFAAGMYFLQVQPEGEKGETVKVTVGAKD